MKQTPAGSRQAAWDDIYRKLTPRGVSWYEPEASASLALVAGLNPPLDTPIIDVGGGASTFVDGLLAAGFTDLSVLDLSKAALEAAATRLGPEARVEWLHEDLLDWTPARRYGIWHDRAVYHFLTEPRSRRRYLELMSGTVTAGGHVIMFAFAPDGPERCSGLPVVRHSAQDLATALAPDFEVVLSGRRIHSTPSGRDQPFTWVVARSVAGRAVRP